MLPLAPWGSRCLRVAALLVFAPSCAPNSAPRFVNPPQAFTGFVGNRLDVTLFASDPDGDTLSFSYDPLEAAIGRRAQLVTLSDRAVFSWTPNATDVGSHAIDFYVSDGTASAKQTIVVTINSSTDSDTSPVFRRPLGYGTTVDLEATPCLRLDVVVDDPDSVAVELSQDAPIPGSTLRAVSPMGALFEWCPDAAQQEQQEHLLRLLADDGDNPPVAKEYLIVLRRVLPTECSGEPPTIAHSEPASMVSLDPIPIEAAISDDHGLKAKPIVYYSFELKEPVDVAAMTQLQMSLASAGTYRAELPNPTTQLAAGEKARVYYLIVAEDDDDPAGPCDHRSQAPASGTFSVEVERRATTPSCTLSKECPVGKVCREGLCVADSCTPYDADRDGLYWERSDCPVDHFCPLEGPRATSGHCANRCSADVACGSERACKVIDTLGGCAAVGGGELGSPCTKHAECAGRLMCLGWSGGYCALSDCDTSGGYSGVCPSGSACYPLADPRFLLLETHWVCAKGCSDDQDCRASEGYHCSVLLDDLGFQKKACLPSDLKG